MVDAVCNQGLPWDCDTALWFAWAEMGRRIPVRCFLHDSSVQSSLTFLRKTPWARKKVEGWFLAEL